MNPDHDDPTFRGYFLELRAEDARNAPPFDALDVAPVVVARPVRLLAAAAVLLAAVALGVWAMRPRPAPSIAEWQSPTRGLLRPPVSHRLTPTSPPTPTPVPALSVWRAPSDVFLRLH